MLHQVKKIESKVTDKKLKEYKKIRREKKKEKKKKEEIDAKVHLNKTRKTELSFELQFV